MKVWELMSELAKRPAGDDVSIGNSHDSYLVSASHVSHDEGCLYIYGDGNYCVTEEDETPQPVPKKSNGK